MAGDFAAYSDDSLVAECNRGEEGAFRVLYNRHKQRVINFAFKMLRDRDAAADVLQETFEYIFRKLPEYRAEGKFIVLLYRVARNICLNRLKKSRRVKELPLDEAAIVTDNPGTSVTKSLEVQELRELVVEALGEISPLYSEVIVLRILKGLPVSEVARIVEIPEGTVKSRLHNGLELLREKLNQEYFE